MSQFSDLLNSDDPRFHHIGAATKQLLLLLDGKISELEDGVVVLEDKVAELEAAAAPTPEKEEEAPVSHETGDHAAIPGIDRSPNPLWRNADPSLLVSGGSLSADQAASRSQNQGDAAQASVDADSPSGHNNGEAGA